MSVVSHGREPNMRHAGLCKRLVSNCTESLMSVSLHSPASGAVQMQTSDEYTCNLLDITDAPGVYA